MKIVDMETVKLSSNRGKKELNLVEAYIFEKENKKIRLTTLNNMETNKAAIVEITEFGDKVNPRSIATKLNQVFILGELPLIAKLIKDNQIIIMRLENFNIDKYNKSDKKPMSDAHIEIVNEKLAEMLA
jgi:GH15 family glucan-1,4-alpha-glucosidase